VPYAVAKDLPMSHVTIAANTLSPLRVVRRHPSPSAPRAGRAISSFAAFVAAQPKLESDEVQARLIAQAAGR
jgi:hypothetical protein